MRYLWFIPITLLPIGLLAAGLWSSRALQARQPGVTLVVNSVADDTDAAPGDGVCETAAGNGVCTLRAAVQESNALTSSETILLPAGLYTFTIPGWKEDMAAVGDLDLRDDVTISGAGAAETIIDAQDLDRIFELVVAGITVHINDVTIQNGLNVLTDGGGVRSYAGQSLSLVRVAVYSNYVASGRGGGVAAGGLLTISEAIFSWNVANFGGGAIYLEAAEATIKHSLFITNLGQVGGAIYSNDGSDVHLVNSTVSLNQSTSGGGLFAGPSLVAITNTTIAGNSADNGGGLYNLAGYTDTISLFNTVIALNDGGNCLLNSPLTSAGYNLDSGNSCGLNASGDLTNTNPLLGPLQDNGGDTLTFALLPGSPAIDAAGNNNCPPADQRGVARPQDGDGNGSFICDMGAYELESQNPPPSPSPTATPTPTATAAPTASPTATPTPAKPGPDYAVFLPVLPWR